MYGVYVGRRGSTAGGRTRVSSGSAERSLTDAVQDLAAALPPGQYRTITLDLIAACIAFGKASFTFDFIGNVGDARTIDNTTSSKPLCFVRALMRAMMSAGFFVVRSRPRPMCSRTDLTSFLSFFSIL